MVTGISRTLACLAAVVLTATACGKSSPTAPPPGGIGEGLGSTSTSSLVIGPPPTDGAGKPTGPAPTRRPGGTIRSGGDGGQNDDADDADEALRSAARGAPGGFAGVLLAPGPAANIVVDVLVQSGVTADGDVIASIRDILAAASQKPVAVRGPATLDASGSVHTPNDIRRFADEQGKPEQGNGTAVIHVLYLDGSFSEPGVLGVAVRGDAVAVFPDQVSRAATPFAPASRIERAVVTHEIGHLLGLVDIYIDEGRDDPDRPGHSTNRSSVMYWAVESDVVAQVLGGPPPVSFDAADQQTLRKIHNGAPRA